jgi:hypothetical protein
MYTPIQLDGTVQEPPEAMLVDRYVTFQPGVELEMADLTYAVVASLLLSSLVFAVTPYVATLALAALVAEPEYVELFALTAVVAYVALLAVPEMFTAYVWLFATWVALIVPVN